MCSLYSFTLTSRILIANILNFASFDYILLCGMGNFFFPGHWSGWKYRDGGSDHQLSLASAFAMLYRDKEPSGITPVKQSLGFTGQAERINLEFQRISQPGADKPQRLWSRWEAAILPWGFDRSGHNQEIFLMFFLVKWWMFWGEGKNNIDKWGKLCWYIQKMSLTPVRCLTPTPVE